MKKSNYALILLLVVASGLLIANREIKDETSKISIPKSLSVAEKKVAIKKWEASPDGVRYKKWQASATGKKVYASAAKIEKSIRDYTDMTAVVTSLSLPKGSRLGFGLMVRINGEDYILAFGSEKSGILNFNNEFEQLHRLKVNDKIIIKSHSVSFAPKYSYAIVAGDYLAEDGKVIYKRKFLKGGC